MSANPDKGTANDNRSKAAWRRGDLADRRIARFGAGAERLHQAQLPRPLRSLGDAAGARGRIRQ